MSTPPNQPVITNSSQIGNPLVIQPATVEELAKKWETEYPTGVPWRRMLSDVTRAAESLREENRKTQELSSVFFSDLQACQKENESLTAQLKAERERVKNWRQALIWIAGHGCEGDHKEVTCDASSLIPSDYCFPCKAASRLHELDKRHLTTQPNDNTKGMEK